MIAPDYEPAALELLAAEAEHPRAAHRRRRARPAGHYEIRAVEGGMLVQTSDTVAEDPATFTVVTKRQPTAEEMEQLLFAWRVAKSVKSNAILLAKDFVSVGVGAGQMNRVNSARDRRREGGREAPTGAVCALATRSCRSRTRSRSCAAAGVHRGHPAGRLDARRGGHREGRRARRRDGLHRHRHFRH